MQYRDLKWLFYFIGLILLFCNCIVSSRHSMSIIPCVSRKYWAKLIGSIVVPSAAFINFHQIPTTVQIQRVAVYPSLVYHNKLTHNSLWIKVEQFVATFGIIYSLLCWIHCLWMQDFLRSFSFIPNFESYFLELPKFDNHFRISHDVAVSTWGCFII